MRRIASHVFAAVALAGLLQASTHAQTPSDVVGLRAEVDQLRQEVNAGMTAGYDQDKKPTPAAAAPAGGGGCGSCGCGSCGCSTCGCGDCGQSCCNSCNSCNSCGTCGCFEPCCHSTGIWAVGEAMWFKYHRADGARVGVNGPEDDAEGNFEITPRITVGWVGCDGLGARVRYWQFDHDAATTPQWGVSDGSLAVDTWSIDFEVFDTFCLNRNWDLEIAAGIRYNEFRETMTDDDDLRRNEFTGYGIVASAELRRLVGCNGALFVRSRASILMSDKDVLNVGDEGVQDVKLKDVVVGQLELAFGYDYIVPYCDGSYAFARVQAEWQDWYNYSSAFSDTTNASDRFGGPSDVGFGGFGFALGLVR